VIVIEKAEASHIFVTAPTAPVDSPGEVSPVHDLEIPLGSPGSTA
jgi:hypothetical protein